MTTIAEILKGKENQFWSITSQASVLEALQLMAEKNIGALLVVDLGKLVGIFSERDYARKVLAKKKMTNKTTVGELMTHEVLYVEPQSTLEVSMALMTTKHVRHLPVLENKRLIGIVTLGDVVKHIISTQKFTIEQLEKYITGV